MEEPKSPCISICVLDGDDVCMGCYRNSAEITDWFMSSNEEKHKTLERAGERMRASTPIRLG
jgi:predicted Fe-S protein YdhL (DUF1289 family)